MKLKHCLILLACLWGVSGCDNRSLPPIHVVDHVDLPRFMGNWYVIANIPTFPEKGAHNAVESYRLSPDGSIETTFTYREGSFSGPARQMNPVGEVVDKRSNAIWGMQFVWPVKADYRIVYLNADYTQTIVGREARDYVWIMARTPKISDQEYQKLVGLIQAEGYDITRINKVPQSW